MQDFQLKFNNMRTLYSMKAIIRDRELEKKAWAMVISTDPQLVSLGYNIFTGYMKRYKFFIEIRKDYIDKMPSSYDKRRIDFVLKKIAKSNETEARLGGHPTKKSQNQIKESTNGTNETAW